MDKERTIKVLLVDDHPVVRDGLKAALATQAHIETVGEATNGDEAVRQAWKLAPDIVFMDIGLPGMSGLEATTLLRQQVPQTKVIILTIYDDKEYVLQALRAGARGYILKTAPSTELIRAVEGVQQGELFLSEGISQVVVQEYLQEADRPDQPELSLREQEVLKLIAQGYSNKEIAQKLSISGRTVESHRERIMHKLDIHTIAGLTKYAINAGLIPLR